MISCGGSTLTGVIGLDGAIGLGSGIVFGKITVFAGFGTLILFGMAALGLVWIIGFGEMMVFCGVIGLAMFVSSALTRGIFFDDDPFLILINGAVVDVPQSVQLSLYSASLRPHFRQNGIVSSTF
jgi:hypothetical protein